MQRRSTPESFQQQKPKNSPTQGLAPGSKLSILEFQVFPGLWLKYLLFSVLALVIASILSQLIAPITGAKFLRRLFYVDAEGNIPTLFSTLTLLLCAILLAVIAGVKKLQNDRYIRHWSWLSIIFAYLALDEAARIHETTIRPLRNLFNTSGLLYYAWVIPAAVLVVMCFFLYLKFLLDLPKRTRFLILLAGGIYISGALIFELFSGQYAQINGRTGMFHVFSTLEELLEMLGVVVFIYALLSYLKSHLRLTEVHIKFY